MSIKVGCQCGQRFKAKDELAGRTVKCPACGAAITIPTAAPPSLDEEIQWERCQFCHEYIDKADYSEHVKQHMALRADGQHTDYATLPTEERDAAVDISNEPRWYLHGKCGHVTGMPEEIIHTYMTNPWFYLADRTFCCGCEKHVPHSECVWQETGENLQAYTNRLRAAKPELRPGPATRSLAWVFRLFAR